MWAQIKARGIKRFGNTIGYERWTDLCQKFLMPVSHEGDMKFSIDMLSKSDARTFSCILEDFKIMNSITFWSDIITLGALERRTKRAKVPDQLQAEYERTKLSQNSFDNLCVIKALAAHVAESSKLQILHLVALKMSKVAYKHLGHGIFVSTRIRRLLIQNCNLGEGHCLHELVDGIFDSH